MLKTKENRLRFINIKINHHNDNERKQKLVGFTAPYPKRQNGFKKCSSKIIK